MKLFLCSLFLLLSAVLHADDLPTLPYQARYLEGLTICLDPGHGGDIGEHYDATGYKRGPSGLREAVINLRITERLGDLLEAAGATVIHTRTEDVEVPLEARTAMARESCADLFLSIHHNTSTRETANFSSMWYHGDGSERPASLDVSRYLSDSIIRHIKPSEPQYSGVYSDKLMYENGFHVLREVNMPAVLLECSFLTNEAEERRLADPLYNDLEAWAIFEALCEWAANGIPRAKPLEMPMPGEPGEFAFELDDGMKEAWGAGALRIRPGSLKVLLNGEVIPHRLDEDILRFTINEIPEVAKLEIQFENRAKNAAITPIIDLRNYQCVPGAPMPVYAPEEKQPSKK